MNNRPTLKPGRRHRYGDSKPRAGESANRADKRETASASRFRRFPITAGSRLKAAWRGEFVFPRFPHGGARPTEISGSPGTECSREFKTMCSSNSSVKASASGRVGNHTTRMSLRSRGALAACAARSKRSASRSFIVANVEEEDVVTLNRSHRPTGCPLDAGTDLSRLLVAPLSVSLAPPERDSERLSCLAVAENHVSGITSLVANAWVNHIANNSGDIGDALGCRLKEIHSRKHF